jgi:cbb3-type cytochrome oxidase cytochrome c subunit
VILFTLAVAVRVPLERLADPTDTTYIPRPDWYFLFLFQMLKLFQGSLEIVGSMVLPGLAVAGLMCVPFIDRGVMTRVRQRTLAMGVVALAALGWTGLTVAAIRSTPPTPIIDVTEMQGPESWQLLSPEELAGIGHYRKEACASCHVGEQKLGPDLATAKKRTKEWLIGHFKDPSAMRPGAQMPPIQLNATQMASLASFIVKLTPDNAQALDAAPQAAVDGAMLYQANHCSVCHQVNGVGMKTGPVLNGVAQRRTREWLEQHFLDPQKMSPGTTMPAYKFSSKDMDRMITYLLSIP